MRLLKRPQSSTTDAVSPPPAPASQPAVRPASTVPRAPASAASLAEREEAYEQARQRIFGTAASPQDDDLENEQLTLQRWLKSQPARSETRDDDDDDPDFRRDTLPRASVPSPLLSAPSSRSAVAPAALASPSSPWSALATSAVQPSVWAPPPPTHPLVPGSSASALYAASPFTSYVPGASMYSSPPFTLQLQGADAALMQAQRWLTHRGIPVRLLSSAAAVLPSLLARFSSPLHAQAELEALPTSLHGALVCSAWLGPPL